MRIIPTTEAHIPAVMQMYDHSRSLMRATGNTVQWTAYPTEADLLDDISRHASYIIEDGVPIATFALVHGTEPTYAHIDHGRWIDPAPYATLHRLAKRPGATGIASLAFDFAKNNAPHIRIDTHHTNTPMRHIAASEGFVHCGTVYMDDHTPRLAYEWWRWDEVPRPLVRYVETHILPAHRNYDPAHGPDHVRRVIARAMVISRSYDISPAIVYAAAAMHDIGICEGRENHHLASGRIIRADATLHSLFSQADIEQIAQAAEDHRASASAPPRSLLGCIVAEADRDIEPETIVRRTILYGRTHHPDLDPQQQWQRTLLHLQEKYSERGYLKLLLPSSPNAQPLSELRSLINDPPRLKELYDRLNVEGER